jgi:cyclopropane-fatty-acyl-phospholipid synthase
MNAEKIFLQNFLGDLIKEPLKVRWYDDTITEYGSGKAEFTLVLNEHLKKSYIIKDASIALGEAYMDKKIDLEGNLQKFIEAIYRNPQSFIYKHGMIDKLNKINSTSIVKQKKDIAYHYDLGNDFYKLWLDESMTYSCAYFKNNEDTLKQAQLNKTEHILKKLLLKKDETLLDIGCGWGNLIIEAAKKYGVHALGITLSHEQYDKVKERIKEENLEALVNVEFMDYRDLHKLKQKFDKVVSVGMLEHVGKANLPMFFEIIENILKPEGISLLHSITTQKGSGTNGWINKYIFPGGSVPLIKDIVSLLPDYDLHLLDVESLRLHYKKTLECWLENFQNNVEEVKKNFDERFIRMWELYLSSCAASFHFGTIDVHQFIFSKGLNNNYPLTREHIYK